MKYWINTVNGKPLVGHARVPVLYRTRNEAKMAFDGVPSLLKLGDIRQLKVEIVIIR